MLIEVFLTIELVTGGNAPNITHKQSYSTMEECEEDAKRFRQSDPPRIVQMRGRDGQLHAVEIIGLAAGCDGKFGSQLNANAKPEGGAAE